MPRILKEGVATKKLTTKGQRRATTYFRAVTCQRDRGRLALESDVGVPRSSVPMRGLGLSRKAGTTCARLGSGPLTGQANRHDQRSAHLSADARWRADCIPLRPVRDGVHAAAGGRAMKQFTKSVEIKAPVQRVYDFLMQPSNLPGVWPNLVSVSNIVAGVGGARDFDWVYKMAGIPFKGHAKAEEAQPGKFVRFHNEGGIPSTFRWTYEGLDGSGTRLTLDVEYAIPTPVIGKVAEGIVAKINERDADTLLANVKDVMEGGTTTVSAETSAH
jgi:uncharacterized membrane protein